MKTLMFKKAYKISAIIFACLFSFFIPAYFYIPQVNIFTKHVIVKTAKAALYVYDPFSDKTERSLLKDGRALSCKDSQPFTSRFKFYYQPTDEPKLRQLFSVYNLSRFKSNPDFLGFLALKGWLRQRYSHGPPPQGLTFHNFDTLKLLRNSSEGQTFDCGTFSYIYAQCVLSIGGQARIVLLQDKEGRGHVVSEIWSNGWDKWIAIDVDHNLYYEHNGTPLNALELHNAFIKEDYEDIKIIRGPPLREDEQMFTLEEELSKYFYFAIRMRNDFFSEYPRWHYKGNLYVNCVQWVDKETSRLPQYVYATNRKEDLYWDLNK